MKRYGEDIPQVLAIVKTGLGWKIPLKKVVRKELESLGNRIFLRDEREITLVSGGPGSSGSIELERNILMLPEGVVGKLGLARGSAVCFVRREQGAAIKKMVLEESQGQTAMAVDIESDLLVRRVMMVNPSPEAALSLFRETYANASLQFPVAPFAASSESIPGLALRRILGLSRADDDSLRRRLVNKRLSERLSDGSWEGDPVLTASMARDLLDLGEEPQASGLPRTTDWLLSRRESAYNPGMFFLSDELVDEQRRIVGLRADGHRVRFRERKRRELKHVLPYDPLVIEPCGPRIMWPNAFVLDALLALGQEDHQRVRRALTSLTKGRWCECGYQNGVVDRASTNLESDAELTKLETETKQLFRYGGLKGPEELMKMDLTKSSGPKMFRISEEKVNGTREYRLSFPNDFPSVSIQISISKFCQRHIQYLN